MPLNPHPVLQTLDTASFIIAALNFVLQLLAMVWLLVQSIRAQRFRALKALSKLGSRSFANIARVFSVRSRSLARIKKTRSFGAYTAIGAWYHSRWCMWDQKPNALDPRHAT